MFTYYSECVRVCVCSLTTGLGFGAVYDDDDMDMTKTIAGGYKQSSGIGIWVEDEKFANSARREQHTSCISSIRSFRNPCSSSFSIHLLLSCKCRHRSEKITSQARSTSQTLATTQPRRQQPKVRHISSTEFVSHNSVMCVTVTHAHQPSNQNKCPSCYAG